MKRAIDLSSKHVEIPREQWEDPWREFEFVEKLLREAQEEEDERRSASGQWWMPNQLGREQYYSYDTSNKWWFGNKPALK